MQLQPAYGRRDEVPLPESADVAFVGLDMRAPPLVQPGFVSSAKNKRIVDGVYETRHGLFTPTWGALASTQFPYRSSYLRNDGADWAAKYAKTYGAGVFSDPLGDVWIVRVCANALCFFRETEVGRIVPFASNVSVAAPVVVVQNFNELVIVRGDTLTSLRWSGNWVDGVVELVPAAIIGGYAAVPPAHYATAWRERTVFLAGRDNLILARVADSTQYDTANGIFFVNRGRGDIGRAAVPIGANSLLILKSQTLHVFTAYAADLSDARLDLQPVELQFDSPKTAIAVDGKVWWLDRRGVRTAQITAIEAGNKVLLSVDSTLSDKIAPLIRRINWAYAATFTAAVTTDRIYFAVALDTQTVPQTMLVWNRILEEWESYDQWDMRLLESGAAWVTNFRNIVDFAPAVPWLNAPRLFAVSDLGVIACLEYGIAEDNIGWDSYGSWLPFRSNIADELVTRGYTAGTNDPKRILRAQVQLDTWNQTFSVLPLKLQAVFDGPGEVKELGTIVRDRKLYKTSAPPFTPNNIDGRFHDPNRQDYSVVINYVPQSGNPIWTAGVTYGANAKVYRDTNGHNYQAVIGGVLAVAPNYPETSPTLWLDMGVDTALTDPLWAVGNVYVAGNPVLRENIYGATHKYLCLVPNTGSLGNIPEATPGQWADLGLDAGYADGVLLLDDNGVFSGRIAQGVRLEDFQADVVRRDINREAPWCQIAVRSQYGAVRVRSVALECLSGRRGNDT